MYEIFICLVVIWSAYVLSLVMFLIVNTISKIGHFIATGNWNE